MEEPRAHEPSPVRAEAATAWWQRSVVYQVYPRSFCDSDGDGIGDLRGITRRLPYLQALGVDVVWLSPVYRSPDRDNGYDISDYRAIQPAFGTLADFDALLAGLHARGMKLMMDLVVNHTSDEHDWFQQARTSRSHPWHDHYIWAEPVDGRAPTNWASFFGGPAWTWNEATGEYYLHLFSRHQPDLNWENPRVRREVHALMRYWLERGVDGFRMDVINLVSKAWGADGRLPDAPVTQPGFLQSGFALTANGPRLLEFLREMRREVLDRHDCITVGECPGITPDLARALTDRDTGALSMVFQFDHVELDQAPGGNKWDLKPLDLRDLKRTLTRWQDALADDGWNSLYLGNHDQPRAVSRYGCDGAHRVASAKMLATCLHGLRGTPYVYQGDEIGMTNYPFASLDECRDVETLNMAHEALQRGADASAVMRAVRAKGRDNARTPMQWSAEPHGGFTTGTPWLAVHPNHVQVNAEAALADPDSVFHHHRRLIALRRDWPVLVHGRHELLWPGHPAVYAYRRAWGDEQVLVLCNFGNALQTLDTGGMALADARVLIANLPLPDGLAGRLQGRQLQLRPWEGLMLHLGAGAGTDAGEGEGEGGP